MRCPACSASNPETARFCGTCGTELSAGCPRCGAPILPGLRFCTSCGHDLSARGDDAELRPGLSERRIVSVLFVDLEGFSGIAEGLDPEDVRSLQSRYFEAARAVVARYRGTLEKFIGDAVVAVWGAPTAHEDDTERSVRAALEMVATVSRLRGPDPTRRLAARAAVATGEAAVTLGADGQGLVSGDLMNTCSRLQGLAPSGTVLVDEATRAATRDLFSFEGQGQLRLRGKARRVEVYRASALDQSSPRLADPAHGGPFVGRERELADLRDLIRRTGEERRPRLVTVVGIAGIGKSRLSWELRRAIDAAPDPVALHTGRAPSYGDGITFAPLAEMVRQRAGIADRTDPEIARRQLSAVLLAYVSDEAERAWIEPRLAVLIDPSPSSGYEAEELFAAWRRFFEYVSDWAPSVLVFEDVQWAEPPMLDFIEYLMSWARDHPIVALVLTRPELLDARPGWGSGVLNHTSIQLDPLAPDEMRNLVSGLAGEVDPDLTDRIVRQSGGVPLYAVEVIRMLRDGNGGTGRRAGAGARGVTDKAGAALPIPDTLRSLVAARLDALPLAERSLVHAAAVLGLRFYPDALSALGGVAPADAAARVGGLVRRQILAFDDDIRSPGRGQLAFVQQVVRDVAYRTLARAERRTLHIAAADYLERTGDPDAAEPLAEHLFEAYDLDPEPRDSKRVGDRAVAAAIAAARRATTLHVPDRALRFLERAAAIAPSADLLEEAAQAARSAGRYDRAEALLREAIADADARGDRRSTARGRALLASVLLSAERHDTAREDLQRALHDLPEWERDPVGVELMGQLARARLLVGENDAAIDSAGATIVAARELDLPNVSLDAQITLATAQVNGGDSDAGMDGLRVAIRDAQERGNVRAELRARNNLAWLATLDDPRQAFETARAGVDLAIRMGVGDLAAQLTDVAAAASIDVGEWDTALALLKAARSRPASDALRISFVATEATIRSLRGERGQERTLSAPDALTDADPQVVAVVDLARAWIALLDGRLGEAIEVADRVVRASIGSDRHTVLVLAARAAIWAGQADLAMARLDMLVADGTRGRAAEAARITIAAGVAALEGRPGAPEAFRDAVERWRALGLRLPLAFSLAERAALTGGDRASSDEADAMFVELGARGALRAIRRFRADRRPVARDADRQ
jgi:class 3 adenylate cyclase/tetratricopeptide (TPR) repeat protein